MSKRYHYRHQVEYMLGGDWRLRAETSTNVQALRDKVIAFLVEKKFARLDDAVRLVRITKYRVYDV